MNVERRGGARPYPYVGRARCPICGHDVLVTTSFVLKRHPRNVEHRCSGGRTAVAEADVTPIPDHRAKKHLSAEDAKHTPRADSGEDNPQ